MLLSERTIEGAAWSRTGSGVTGQHDTDVETDKAGHGLGGIGAFSRNRISQTLGDAPQRAADGFFLRVLDDEDGPRRRLPDEAACRGKPVRAAWPDGFSVFVCLESFSIRGKKRSRGVAVDPCSSFYVPCPAETAASLAE